MEIIFIIVAFFCGAACWHFRDSFEIRQVKKRRHVDSPDCTCLNCLSRGKRMRRLAGKRFWRAGSTITEKSFNHPELRAIWRATIDPLRNESAGSDTETNKNSPESGGK